jgi:hypothetical protein
MSTLELILAIAALIFGIVSEAEGNARNWAGWGVVCLAAIFLIGRFG